MNFSKRVPYTKIIDETAKASGKDKNVVRIIVKHFLRGVMIRPSKYLSFKELGLFHLYRKKRKKE